MSEIHINKDATRMIQRAALMHALMKKRGKIFFITALFIVLAAGFFAYNLQPVAAEEKQFVIAKGDGIDAIANTLKAQGLIRSEFAFKAYIAATGKARELKPGNYDIPAASSVPAIVQLLVQGSRREIRVTIVEGDSMYEIDQKLAVGGILAQGTFLAYAKAHKLEGRLFPDTYLFHTDSPPEEIAARFEENFKAKTAELFRDVTPERQKYLIIMASILEDEVPAFEERRVVAGILEKRINERVPLQVDASVCYVKLEAGIVGVGESCYPLTMLDLKRDSPYNSYLYRGMLPGPIGNPGIEALKAAASPVPSPYWFYISDPKTGKTIFAQTLKDHNRNRAHYFDN